ncbi:hypothetical protein MPLB_1490078 [Mesorhizobium sp. ORS 3324]|nr:hypothetical protein MPLB_1490078 [Mesorhizobium sp. ORS 3324]
MPKNDENHGGGARKIDLTVVVNGQATEVEANPNQPLQVVRTKALENTQNIARPAENWEFKDEAGIRLDVNKKVGEFGFANGRHPFPQSQGRGRRCLNSKVRILTSPERSLIGRSAGSATKQMLTEPRDASLSRQASQRPF